MEESSSSASKKRKAVNSSDEQSPEVKRSRINAAEAKEEDDIMASVEDMLAVPLSFIFREVTSGKSKRPLLSRSEAQCFLQVNLLSSSMDSLTEEISQLSLHQSLQCKSFRRCLQDTDHLYLRSLLVTLHTLGTIVPTTSLSFVKTELAEITSELQRIVASLRQCSEQNWTLAETLQDCAFELSQEKRKLSDIQEEICRRIDNLVDCSEDRATSTRSMMPMKAYCDCILSPTDGKENEFKDQEVSEEEPSAAVTARKNENQAKSKQPEVLNEPPAVAAPGIPSSKNNDYSNASDEILEDPPATMACSAITTPPDSPEAPQLSEPEDTAANTSTTDTPKPLPANTFQPHRLSAARSSAKQRTPSTSTFQPQRLLETSKETKEGTEEKENAPSQSSSQHSSQHTPHSVLAASESEASPSCFRSQAAAEVLSSMAAATTTRTVTAWRGGEHSSENQSPNP